MSDTTDMTAALTEAIFLTDAEVAERGLAPIVPINVPGLVVTGYHVIRPINQVATTELSADAIAAITATATLAVDSASVEDVAVTDTAAVVDTATAPKVKKAK